MDYDDRIIIQKTVDWSLLNDGITNLVLVCALLKAWDESILTHVTVKNVLCFCCTINERRKNL